MGMATITMCRIGDDRERQHEVAWQGTGAYMPEQSPYGYLPAEIALLAHIEGRTCGEHLIARVSADADLAEADEYLREWHSVGNGSIRDISGDNLPGAERLHAAS